MIEYRTLESLTDETLHAAFTEAFSDYYVKFEMSTGHFMTKMLKRKSFRPDISVGAFSKGKMVGFVYNGLRTINGCPTAYDCGTALIPEFRGKKIGREMLNITKEILQKNNVSQYLLEVIQDNKTAVKLYLNEGFEVTRELNCYTLNIESNLSYHDISVQQIETTDFDIPEYFFDFIPSWQNSKASILEIPDEFKCVIYKKHGISCGFGFIEPDTGDIPLLAVSKKHRGKGIGTMLIRSLYAKNQSNHLKVINVESTSDAFNKFLQKQGFNLQVKQYEMLKSF